MNVTDQPTVTENQIVVLVRSFYDAARADPSLGPIFNAAVSDWDSHIQTVADFWSHVLLGTKRYGGHPYPVHLHLPIKFEDFDRWLALFTKVADATLPADAAAKVKSRAGLMADSFRNGMFPFAGADGKPSRLPLRP